MSRLEIALLGPPRIILDGQPVETDRHKAIGLLAYLALEAKDHSRETLAALLWPDYPRASAFSYLRRTLWELNHILGKGWIESGHECVTLVRLPELSLDTDTFQRLLASGSCQVTTLAEAISLYRGDFLENFVIADTQPFQDWQLQQAEYFRREFARALEKLVALQEQNGDYASALANAQRWLALDRLNEVAYRAAMRQMAGMGDRSGAVRLYQSCLQTLHSELGVAPQPETEELYQAILHAERPEAPPVVKEQPLTPSSPRPVGNLPSPTTLFIGRRPEIEHILNLALDPDTHLLTLTGPGGTGKTRLSIQIASEMSASFPDGVWFIPLAPVQSLSGIILAIAQGLSFSFYTDQLPPRQQLLDYLRYKHLLLVLDNFEHLMESGPALVADILDAAQDVKLLVTSRQRLNLKAEQVYRVTGMRIPEMSTVVAWDDPMEQARPYSSIQLLLERARRVCPDFHLTRENSPAVTHICQLVEGSPLGIELAVPWLELLSPEEIASEIARSLDFLESSAPDIPDRQRSLRAVFNTSWNLLDASEQQAFRRLCVFQGSFSRPAAQEVSGSTLRTLLGLANKSWLQPREDGRYQLHEVLRQYGMERLQADQDEWRQTKDRHADYFAAFLQVHAQALQTSEQVQALQVLKSEFESNIPQAWDWLVSAGRFDLLIEKLLPGLFHYALIRFNSANEFIGLLKHARKSVPISTDREHLLQRLILETVETSFELSWSVLDDQPKERLEQVWAQVEDFGLQEEMGFWYILLLSSYGRELNFELASQRFADVMLRLNTFQNLWNLGYLYLLASGYTPSGQTETRKKHLSASLATFQKIGVVQEQGVVLRQLGELAAIEKNFTLALEYSQAARRLFEQVDDTLGVDSIWTNLTEYYIYLGKIDQAFHAFEELRCFNEKNGNRRQLGINLSWESLAVSRYGDLDDALHLRKMSLEIALEVENQHDIAWHTWELGEIYRLMGDLEQAREYYQQARPAFEKFQDFIGLGFYHRGCAEIAILQADWAEAQHQYQQALASLEREQRSQKIWALSLCHARLGTVLVQLGAFSEARQHLQTSLSIAEEIAHPELKALALTGIASLLATTGSPVQAVEIAACVASQPTTWNETKAQARLILDAASQALPPPQARLSQARGPTLELDTLTRQYLNS
jgi:predicted ATPase/DNA-binding SARP family transcriptional activator